MESQKEPAQSTSQADSSTKQQCSRENKEAQDSDSDVIPCVERDQVSDSSGDDTDDEDYWAMSTSSEEEEEEQECEEVIIPWKSEKKRRDEDFCRADGGEILDEYSSGDDSDSGRISEVGSFFDDPYDPYFYSSEYEDTENSFKWRNGSKHIPKKYTFDDTDCGLQEDSGLTKECTEMDCLLLFFDQPLMDDIVKSTNDNFKQKCGSDSGNRSKTAPEWKDLTIDELYVYLAIRLLMGRTQKYTDEDTPTTSQLPKPDYGKYMSIQRFIQIFRFIRFAPHPEESEADIFIEIRPVISALNERFMRFFRPFQNIVINESAILFEGLCVDDILIMGKDKFTRFGTRVTVLCDCKTGIVLTILPNSDVSSPSAMVRKIISPYLGKGHILYMGRKYTSPLLCLFLYRNNTGSCGWVKKDRKYMPVFPERKQGECIMYQANNVLAIKWSDNKVGLMLSTIHKAASQSIVTHISIPIAYESRPEVVLDFSLNVMPVTKLSKLQIGLVDRTINKTIKWYKHFFFRLFDVSVLNAYKLFLLKTEKKQTLAQFVHNLAHQLVENYDTRLPRKSAEDRLLCREFVLKHFLGKQPCCLVCTTTVTQPQVNNGTKYKCKGCNMGLCT